MKRFLFSFLVLIACSKPETNVESSINSVDVWETSADRSSLLQKSKAQFTTFQEGLTIAVDTATQYQKMDGFGFSLTGGSAMLLNQKLSVTHRDSLLRELFSADEFGIGISYLRISIGASDLDDHVFSYDDLQEGQTDFELDKFSLAPDQSNLIPILKQIKRFNSSVKIIASPWSSPLWMKDNHLPKGGSLKKDCYSVYAKYLLKYILAMADEGIVIDAITTQNEPENPNNTPSMLMTAIEQNEFIRDHLGPTFKKNNMSTKIVLFDHNADHPEYPITILNDSITKPFVDGSAFHLYLGEVEALSKVHEAHPDKNIYFTEQWTSGKGDFGGDLKWHIKNLIIGASRNWSKAVLEWNLAADENYNPHTNYGGCDLCQGALIIYDNKVTRNVSYYIIGHASKFVPSGSIRIASNNIGSLYNVAFLRPDGKKVLIVLNEGDQFQNFIIQQGNKFIKAGIKSGSVASFVW